MNILSVETGGQDLCYRNYHFSGFPCAVARRRPGYSRSTGSQARVRAVV